MDFESHCQKVIPTYLRIRMGRRSFVSRTWPKVIDSSNLLSILSIQLEIMICTNQIKYIYFIRCFCLMHSNYFHLDALEFIHTKAQVAVDPIKMRFDFKTFENMMCSARLISGMLIALFCFQFWLVLQEPPRLFCNQSATKIHDVNNPFQDLIYDLLNIYLFSAIPLNTQIKSVSIQTISRFLYGFTNICYGAIDQYTYAHTFK